MVEEACMAATRFKPCHLGGTHVEGVVTPTECSGTTTRLMVRFQQRDSQSLPGEQARCGQTGYAAADHAHAHRRRGRRYPSSETHSQEERDTVHVGTAQRVVCQCSFLQVRILFPFLTTRKQSRPPSSASTKPSAYLNASVLNPCDSGVSNDEMLIIQTLQIQQM